MFFQRSQAIKVSPFEMLLIDIIIVVFKVVEMISTVE